MNEEGVVDSMAQILEQHKNETDVAAPSVWWQLRFYIENLEGLSNWRRVVLEIIAAPPPFHYVRGYFMDELRVL
jgi:hypothetical protein